MSNDTDSKVPAGDDLSREIRAKVAEAGQFQRKRNEALVHARGVLSDLRPTLDEIAAYLHRETSLDVQTGLAVPTSLENPLTDGNHERVTAETREVTVPTVPPTSLQGGYQVQASVEGVVVILAFWGIGDCAHSDKSHCWSERFTAQLGTPQLKQAVSQASEALRTWRHKAAEHLLEMLKQLE